MKISLFYELQLPRPWSGDAEEKLVNNVLEQIALADKLGFHCIWQVEHHFLEEYSHSSAPEVFLAAASQRTNKIRLGHGIASILPGYNHPARLVERAAMLDLLSGGRLEFGMGESTTKAELLGFGHSLEDKTAIFDEVVKEIPKMFVESPYPGHDGRAFRMPPRNILPKAKQKPHPPLWMACSNVGKIQEAAKMGLGVLHFAFTSPDAARAHVDAYHATMEQNCVPIGYAVNPNLAVTVGFSVHKDEQVALDRGMDGVHFFAYSLFHYAYFGEHRPGRLSVAEAFDRHRNALGFGKNSVKPSGRDLAVLTPSPEEEAVEKAVPFLQPGAIQALRGAVGSVDQVRAYMRAYEDAGVDQIILNGQHGRTRHEDIMESIELFGREILPELIDRDAKAEPARLARNARIADRAMKRRQPAEPTPDHVIPATRGTLPAGIL